MNVQSVTRTRPKQNSTYHEPAAYEKLSVLLNQGYKVVMCNEVGAELEYILEKEIDDKN